MILAEQEYVKVERTVNSLEQVDVEHKRILTLYDDKITSKHREFPIKEVMDISYREIGGKGAGLLYLHTTHGVYSYTVKSSPKHFIHVYKQLTNK
ncbi:hypothetical protein [Ornithinibacillus halotolerans]|uniref:Uncharacterized protein n=1 Tax=Ornithinibacillus halotolerans TaxID=1274357 RepID=A0A916SB60_9BACI|nr:hypothetical protein [Ornithinibacillus halotolerans]GGA89639.1 hypothetical protein GCM10008025_35300 [Ornithinibacillus halotolerans]